MDETATLCLFKGCLLLRLLLFMVHNAATDPKRILSWFRAFV